MTPFLARPRETLPHTRVHRNTNPSDRSPSRRLPVTDPASPNRSDTTRAPRPISRPRTRPHAKRPKTVGSDGCSEIDAAQGPLPPILQRNELSSIMMQKKTDLRQTHSDNTGGPTHRRQNSRPRRGRKLSTKLCSSGQTSRIPLANKNLAAIPQILQPTKAGPPHTQFWGSRILREPQPAVTALPRTAPLPACSRR